MVDRLLWEQEVASSNLVIPILRTTLREPHKVLKVGVAFAIFLTKRVGVMAVVITLSQMLAVMVEWQTR